MESIFILFIFIFFIISGFTIYNFLKFFSIKKELDSTELELKVEENSNKITTLVKSIKNKFDKIDEDFSIFKTNTITDLKEREKDISTLKSKDEKIEKDISNVKTDISKFKIDIESKFITSDILIINDIYSLIKQNKFDFKDGSFFEPIFNKIYDERIILYCVGQAELTNTNSNDYGFKNIVYKIYPFKLLYVVKKKLNGSVLCDLFLYKDSKEIKGPIVKKVDDSIIITGLTLKLNEQESLVQYFVSYIYPSDEIIIDRGKEVKDSEIDKIYKDLEKNIFPEETKKKIIIISLGRAATLYEKIKPNLSDINYNPIPFFGFSDTPSSYIGNIPITKIIDNYGYLQERKDPRFYGYIKFRLNYFV